MIELHGWVTIKESYKSDDDDENIKSIIEEIKKFIFNLEWESGLMDLNFYNGTPAISIAVFKNRLVNEVKEVFDLLNFIAKIANGSYGIIYLHDDEDLEGKDNSFQVYSLAKGVIEEHEDRILSPIIPKVEDSN